MCLRGSCTVDLDDGRGARDSVRLDREDVGLLLYPHLWRTVRDFAEGTLLLAVADTEYDEKDYIRERAAFEALARQWDGPGGAGASSPA